jgi:Big-like domain-containing protein
MTRTRTLTSSLAAALVAALSIAAGTASATSPPTFTAGQGCSVQCISKAAVTATAKSAKVELATTVPANLKVTVGKGATGGNGGLVANQFKTVYVSANSPLKTAFFLDLEADTTYSIAVRATDLQGRSSVRSGSFKTLPYKTTGHSGSNTLDSGLGCSQQCIMKALVSQKQPDGTSARIEIKTSTTAHIQIDVSRDKPTKLASGGLAQYDVVSRQWTGADTKSWTPQVTGLEYGTKYYVVVRARDAQGRVSMRQGSFRTVSATATITFHRIKVLNDGDKVGKGELFFNLWINRDYAWGTGLRKLNSGDTTNVNPQGSSRPGFSYEISADGDAAFSVEMLGEECDERKKNCVLEANEDGYVGATFPQWALAAAQFDVSELLGNDALPGWYGTGVTPPAGHDGYFTFGTTDHYVKFLVLATIDLHVDWP